eukprot:gene6558-9008_t
MSEVYDFPLLNEKVTSISLDTMSRVLDSSKYAPGKAAEHIDTISTTILDKLKNISGNFKYIVTCTIIQKVGAGVHYESVSHWDAKSDGAITTKHETETMVCLCSVFGIGLA